MSHIYPHIYPEITDWPIWKFGQSRKEFITELNQIVFNHLVQKYDGRLDELLNKTIYLEKLRVKNTPWKVDPSDDKTLWNSLNAEVNQAMERSDKDEALGDILLRIINRYNEEIVGGFKKKTFKFARKFLAAFFKRIINRFNEKGKRIFWGSKSDLIHRIYAEGHVDETRALFDKGTVVIVPTHFSNIDSIMIGYALDTVAGMPAFTYGAGLNLYDAEIPAYFMNRLGAYRVDRRKKNPIYLECLTSMASLSLSKGVNNIFFPGGTRSRSGAMEEKLKLGLLGSVIDAQRELILSGSDHKIFVVPVVLGYHFVFEAKSLVEQHLREKGREKYTKSKENKTGGFSFQFLKKFFTEKSEFYLSFGEPMDVLGNLITEDGVSVDKHCRPVELKDYFVLDGEISENNQRESVYAKLLGSKVLESYFRNNLILSSHLVAFTAFKLFESKHSSLDIFAILRMLSNEFLLDLDEFKLEMEGFLQKLITQEKEGKIRLHKILHSPVDVVIKDALEYLGAYHTQKVLYINDNNLKSNNIRLLYFYHNRLEGYSFEKQIDSLINK